MINIHTNTLTEFERSEYPYSLFARRESIKKNQSALQAIREEHSGISLKEALTSDTLSGFIPDLFLDTVQVVGQHTAVFRNNFPVVGQSTHGSFKVRLRYRDEQPVTTSKELVEFKHTQSERETDEFSFLKIMDSVTQSIEFLEDSILDELTAEIQLASNRFFRRESQLGFHRLAEYSQGTRGDKWSNWVLGASDTGANIFAAMKTGFLDISTRLTDRYDPSLLTWFVSPEVYTLLFDITAFQEFRLSGLLANNVTGKIGVNDTLLNVPIVICEPGYYNADSQWQATPYDVYLAATGFVGGLRERSSLRTTPLDLNRILGNGIGLWERLIPFVQNGFALRRISPNENYTDMIGNMTDIHILAGTDSPKVFNN